MNPGRGKAIALSSVAAGGAIMVVGVVFSWGRIREEWLIRRLGSRDPEAWHAAAEGLVEMGSLRAIPRFLEIVSGENVPLEKIIDRRGPAAEPWLTACFRHRDERVRANALCVTLKNFPHHAAALEVIRRGMEDEREWVRDEHLGFLKVAGEDPVPCLGTVLRRAGSADAREWAASVLEKLGAGAEAAAPALIEAAGDGSIVVRVAVSCALARIGASEETFRAGLLEGLRLEDGARSRHALVVLEAVGGSSLPLLIGALRPGPVEARLWAASRLRELGPHGKPAAAALEDLLVDESSGEDLLAARTMAALALLEMNRPSEDLLPWLARGIWTRESRIDELCVTVIEELGRKTAAILPDLLEDLRDLVETDFDPYAFSKLSRAIAAAGQEALPELLELLHDPRPQARAISLMVFRGLKSGARPAIPAIRKALHDRDAEVAFQAARALAGFVEHAEEALPILMAELGREEDPERRLEALKLLGSLGTAAGPAVGAMVLALRERDWVLRLAAAEALARVGPEAQAVAGLADALRDRDEKVRVAAAAALREFGPEAWKASAALENAGSDPGASGIWAACALMAVQPDRQVACLKQILRGLRSGNDSTRSEAVRALGVIGPDARAALPDLFELALRRTTEPLRVLAGKAIGRIGLADATPLVKALSRGDAVFRARAANCLAELGRIPAGAVPVLAEALSDSDENVRAAAARALGCAGEVDSGSAMEALRRAAAEDRSLPVRQAARSSLKAIRGGAK